MQNSIRSLIVAAAVVIAGTGGAEAAGVSSGESISPAAAMSYYDFHSANPKDGFCEQQTFGRGRLLAEPWNVAFSIPTVILGLVGLFRSKRSAMAFQFLYGLPDEACPGRLGSAQVT